MDAMRKLATARMSRHHLDPRMSHTSELHGVRERGEVEILYLDRRKHDVSSRLRTRDSLRPSEHLEIAQHEQRTLIEAEILHRLGDLSVFDEERAVSREACVQRRARIHLAEIPESRDENAARRGSDHLLGRRVAAGHLHRAKTTIRTRVLLLCPEARVGELLEHAILDPDFAIERQPLAVHRMAA